MPSSRGACVRPSEHDNEIKIETKSRDELQGVEQEHLALEQEYLVSLRGFYERTVVTTTSVPPVQPHPQVRDGGLKSARVIASRFHA